MTSNVDLILKCTKANVTSPLSSRKYCVPTKQGNIRCKLLNETVSRKRFGDTNLFIYT